MQNDTKTQTASIPPTDKELLALLKTRPEKGFSERELADHFLLRHRDELYALADVVEALMEQNKIYFDDELGTYMPAAPAKGFVEAEAVLEYISPRKAFGVVEGLVDDLILDPGALQSGQNGDKIRVRYRPSHNGGQAKGQVLEVLERARTEFVGTLRFAGRKPLVSSDMKRVHEDIFIEPDYLGGANEGDKVVLTISNWAGPGGQMVGRITQVLGRAGTHQAEMRGILAEFGLPVAFSETLEEEANKIKAGITKTEVAKRRDMRAVSTFTIDPIDAKDFDDAISLERLEGGNFRIGVHIADVTHYVRPGTALELEAQQRATSVYLVDRVVPMLPEKLSNELCSLRPHEDKLTFSAVFDLTPKGQVLDRWFGRTAIHSDRRFSYEQVQEIIEGAEGDFKEEIMILNGIAHALRADRFANGAVSFETPELKFELDAAGKPIKVIPKIRKDAHKLVEDFMLLANKHVAEFVYGITHGEPLPTPAKTKTKKASEAPVNAAMGGPMVYRVHEAPDAKKIDDLAAFAARFGHKLNIAATKSLPKALNALSQEVEHLPEGPVIGQYAIRSMQKARYTTDALGHFGLGFAHYSHFTSPIRRYPDMMAHRLLAEYLTGEAPQQRAELEKLCKTSNQQEKRAADAERASIKYKQVEFMMERIGEEFAGIVSGLTEWGLYVEITETASEGLVRLADLHDDHYDYDPDRLVITGRRNGRRFQFGDAVRVRVKDANLLKRTLDLELADLAHKKAYAGRGDRGNQRSKPDGGERRGKPSKFRR